MSGEYYLCTKSIKKEHVLSLRKLDKQKMDTLTNIVQKSLLSTVDLLTTEFCIYSWDFLPYEAYAIILAYIFSKRKALTLEEINRVKRWFWISSFSERYRGASEHFISKDLEHIGEYILNDTEPSTSFGPIPKEENLARLAFRSNNSRSRAFILMLAINKPRNLTNGAIIDTANSLSNYNKKQFHHIYPKAFLESIGTTMEKNTPVNICILTSSENIYISDSNPNLYLPKLASKHKDNASEIFKSNLLPDPFSYDYSNLSYEQFLTARASLIHAEMTRLCNGDYA